MTPYEEECERMRKIASRVEPEAIWAQVYSIIFALNAGNITEYENAGRAKTTADAAVRRFLEHVKP